MNCRNTVNLGKWASWSEWLITDFLPLGVTASSRFYSPLLSLNLHTTKGVYYERGEGKESILVFLGSQTVRKEHTGRIKPVNSVYQLRPAFPEFSVIKALGKGL